MLQSGFIIVFFHTCSINLVIVVYVETIFKYFVALKKDLLYIYTLSQFFVTSTYSRNKNDGPSSEANKLL